MPPERLRSLPDSLLAGVEATPSGEFYWQATVEAVQDEPTLVATTVRVTGAGEFTASTYFFDAAHAASAK